jgi:hypothetical protein
VGDFVNLSPVAVGQELGADDINSIITDIPLVWDFPAYSLSQTLVATDLLQSAFTVPSNSMGDHRRLTLNCKGTFKNAHTSGDAAPAFSVKYGSTVLIDSGLGPATQNSANLGYFDVTVTITQNGATDAQVVVMNGEFGDKDDITDFDTGEGGYTMYDTNAKGFKLYGWNNTTVDMNASATLAFLARCAVSSSNYVVALEVGKAWIL